ncbi:MAG: hypothetical protein WC453_04020 [Patescibacteria group bacterium]
MLVSVAGYLSGLAILLSFLPYVRDILRGQTRPERMSWLIWALLGVIFFSTQLAEGATFSLILPAAQTAGDLLIFVLAIKWGYGGLLKRDIGALGGLLLGLILWGLTKEAAVALFIVILIDAMGAALTAIKSYEQPASETPSAWWLTFIGGALGCLAVGSLNGILLVFPVYICLASASILLAIRLGKRKVR